jgi:hypothetical protein
MIIFNPVASGIRKLPSIPRGLELITFDQLYSAEFGKKFIHKQYSAYMKGGSDEGDGDGDDSVMLTSVEDANERSDDPEIQTMIERGDAAGRQWNARVGFELDLPIVETLQVRPWPTTVAKARSTTRRVKREHSLPRRPQL